MPHLRSQAQVPEGRIHLIIYELPGQSPFLLEIPTGFIETLCTRPRKYLRYLGWCILGVDGHVSMQYPAIEEDIGNNGLLVDAAVYCYKVRPGLSLPHSTHVTFP